MSETGVKLFFYNYVTTEILTNYEASSEAASFPIENAFNAQRRSKVWRSAGYFNVTSSNNSIVLRETSGGPDLTATITVAEYTSISAMCTAIKTALEAVGASTYTVTNSTSTGFKFQIVSNGAGGSGVFHLMLADAGTTAESLLGYSNASNLTDASLTRLGDYLRINSEESILWDLGLSTNPKAFILIGPRNEPLKIAPSATLTLQASHHDSWTTPGFSVVLTYDDQNIYHLNTAGIADTEYRYWRLKIEDQNPLGYIEVGAFFLGDYWNPTRGRAQFPLSVADVDPSETSSSEGGQTYSDIKPQTATYSLKWFGLQKADIEEFEEEFQTYGVNKPFFVGLDTNLAYSSSLNKRVIFGQMTGDAQWSLIAPDVFELTMTIREVL
jgi:hypothetical protein